MAAGFGIDELKAQIGQSGGLAQAHQFMVKLPQLRTFKVDAQELSLLCSATVLPGRQIMSLDYAIGTTNRKIANGFAITDVTLTFIVANNHIVRQYFEAWQNEAHDPVTKEIGYYDDYTYDVSISTMQRGLRQSLFKKQIGGLNKIPSSIRNRLPSIGPLDLSQGEVDAGIQFKMKETFTCKLLECYPTTMNEQALGNAQEGVMEFSVQLSYSNWESKVGKFTSNNEGLGQSLIGGVLGKILG